MKIIYMTRVSSKYLSIICALTYELPFELKDMLFKKYSH